MLFISKLNIFSFHLILNTYSKNQKLVLLRGAGRRDTDKSGSRTIETVDLDLDEISKRGFDHFMLKEVIFFILFFLFYFIIINEYRFVNNLNHCSIQCEEELISTLVK